MTQTAEQFVPKYWNLAEQFRERIASGELQPGDRLPSYSEMRVLFGVSRPVTERVHGLLERQGLIVREAGRGIYVRESQKHARVIGFAGPVPGVNAHPYWIQILEGVHAAAASAGAQVLLLTEPAKIEWGRLDGLIISESDPSPWLRQLPPETPYVVLLTPQKHSPYVAADDRQATYNATSYLIGQGHRRIAFLTVAYDKLSSLRVEGYRAALKDAGIECDPRWLRVLPSTAARQFADAGRGYMAAWLAEDWPQLGCTALLTQNDDTAMGAIQALREAHLDVPGDVSVIGFDGTELSAFFSPPLTTVEVPLREISRIGTEMLLRKVENPARDVSPRNEAILVPTKLVVRDSTSAR